MKKILFINDGSNASMIAARNAMSIAQMHQANILVANLKKTPELIKVVNGTYEGSNIREDDHDWNFSMYADPANKFVPEIGEVDASSLAMAGLADIINQQDVWMVISGYATDNSQATWTNGFCTLLTKINCPLLLLPDNSGLLSFERLAYLTDLRYCQLKILRFLISFAAPYSAHILLAHQSAKGLPDIEQNYAKSIFKELIGTVRKYDNLRFENIKEKQTAKVLDVLIHGMQNKLLVMVNNHLHFEDLAEVVTDCPKDIAQSVPLLFFPY